jgi:OPA family sugar phosphate sensor protein UhpC-like MFS transporter
MRNILRFFATDSDRTPLSDRGQIDKLYRRNRISVMLSITLGYGIYYTCRLGMSVVKKPLIDQGIFTAEELGMIGSAIFYTYAFGRLVNGFLADHSNVKKFFPLGLLLSAMINLIIGNTTLFWVWVVLWGLNGWFQGFGSPSSVVALSHWFSNRERGRYYGIWGTAHSIGEGLTFIVSSLLVTVWGWQGGFVGPGTFCILAAVILYYTLRDRPATYGLPDIADWKNDHGITITSENKQKLSVGKTQFLILKLRPIWILGFACAMMSATRYAINSWGILYLQEAKGYSLLEAGSILGLNTLAGIAGCTAYGFISDKLFAARRPPVTLIYGLIEVLSLFIIFYAPPGHPALLTLAFVIYGFSMSGILVALGGLFAVDIAPKRVAGAAMGFIGIFSYLGAAFQERISGHLIQQGITMLNGVRNYDFSKVILFWIGCSVISLILATALWRVKIAE